MASCQPEAFSSHEENLKKVCILYMQKASSMTILTETTKQRINTFRPLNLPFEDNRVPKVICGTCRVHLQHSSNDKKEYAFLCQVSNYKKTITRASLTSNSTSPCCCKICLIARKTGAIPKAKSGPFENSGVDQAELSAI